MSGVLDTGQISSDGKVVSQDNSEFYVNQPEGLSFHAALLTVCVTNIFQPKGVKQKTHFVSYSPSFVGE